MKQEIKLFNTKSRNIEIFSPLEKGKVGIYSCGPTVYHYIHLGNLRAFIFADTLHRIFKYADYEVNHVMNITDVGHLVSDGDEGEDKLEKGAKREGKNAWDIADFYTKAFFQDIKILNINTSEYIYPRATDTISEQIDLIKSLEKKGYTYIISDGVYFDTSKFSKYKDFAKLDLEGLQEGIRVEENKEKINITDFALWKFSPTNEKRDMEWESPWGLGFPGWHLECSAMSKKYLGSHFDIHTGGIDHIPVHHTNEIAQSECANGQTYVNYWMHNNFLNDQTGKMSKSKGDFLRMQTLVDENINPLAFRYHLMTAHYRSEIVFSLDSLKASASAYEKLVSFVKNNYSVAGKVNEKYKGLFEEALFEDVSTPAGVAIIWKLIKDENISNEDKTATLFLFDEILGLNLQFEAEKIEEKIFIPDSIKQLLEKRREARESKNWEESDKIRDKIKDLGFLIKDIDGDQEIAKI